MHQKISAGGFVEVLILLAGLTGLTAFGIIKASPTLQSSTAAATHFSISPTATPTAMPSIEPNPVQTDEVTGVGLTENFEIEVILNGEQHMYPLFGIQKVSSDSASCIRTDIEDLNKIITGHSLYLV